MAGRDDFKLPFVFIPDGAEAGDADLGMSDSLRLRAVLVMETQQETADLVPADERGVIPHEDLPPPPGLKPPPAQPPGFPEG